jgi:excinuclease ABC subunit A
MLQDVGLGYITLGQQSTTLSGGEAQRVKLATELAKKQTGKTIYILDEPTIGLHSRDNDRLIQTLHKLRDAGNSIIVVEHDEDTIYSSDYLVDIGPGAGASSLMMRKTSQKLSDALVKMLPYDTTGEIAVLYQDALSRGN